MQFNGQHQQVQNMFSIPHIEMLHSNPRIALTEDSATLHSNPRITLTEDSATALANEAQRANNMQAS